MERRYGSFIRSFTLPNTVNAEDVSADYTNGVLKIKLGKRAEAKPKQIKVNIGERPGRTRTKPRFTASRAGRNSGARSTNRKGGGAKIPSLFFARAGDYCARSTETTVSQNRHCIIAYGS